MAGGAGSEFFGDPMGGGGPFHVVRALAVSGRVVRVVFTEDPKYSSPAGLADAMNPTNYAFSIDAGTATSPVAAGTDPDLVVGPARGVGNGGATDERGVDVHVDRALIIGVTYRVSVSARVTALIGGAIGAPYSAALGGVVPLLVTEPGSSVLEGTDLANSPFLGSWKADDSGDLAPQLPSESFRKRVLRRLATPKDSWSFLRDYGVTVALKEVASLAQLAALQTDLKSQLLREPESEAVAVKTELTAGKILTISVSIRTKRGSVLDAKVVSNPDGSFQVL